MEAIFGGAAEVAVDADAAAGGEVNHKQADGEAGFDVAPEGIAWVDGDLGEVMTLLRSAMNSSPVSR